MYLQNSPCESDKSIRPFITTQEQTSSQGRTGISVFWIFFSRRGKQKKMMIGLLFEILEL